SPGSGLCRPALRMPIPRRQERRLGSSRLSAMPPIGRGRALSTIRLCARAGESPAALPIIRYRIGVPPESQRRPGPTRPESPLRAGFTWAGPALLFDDLVGAQDDRRWYRKPERRGSLAVHDHLEFCRELHREIARLLAAQYAIHVGG